MSEDIVFEMKRIPKRIYICMHQYMCALKDVLRYRQIKLCIYRPQTRRSLKQYQRQKRKQRRIRRQQQQQQQQQQQSHQQQQEDQPQQQTQPRLIQRPLQHYYMFNDRGSQNIDNNTDILYFHNRQFLEHHIRLQLREKTKRRRIGVDFILTGTYDLDGVIFICDELRERFKPKDILKLLPYSPDQHFQRCPICLLPFDIAEKIIELHCSHNYHVTCIDKWLQGKCTCPICRFKVYDEADIGFYYNYFIDTKDRVIHLDIFVFQNEPIA